MLLANKADFCAPWAERLPTGDLLSYGPSPSTYARHVEAFKLWSYRPDKQPSKESRTETAARLRAWMRPDGEHLRTDVPKRELEVFIHIYERGHSARWVARHLEITRASVRVYVRRLWARMGV